MIMTNWMSMKVFSIVETADDTGSSYVLRTIRQINPQIFSWLDLLDANVSSY